jgi:tetratricopeptide (TPR) repeat protein
MSQVHNDGDPDTARPRPPVEVFYSYSHKDEEFIEKLIPHLSLLKRKGVITGWYDRQISAGTEWKNRIHERLESAGVILLLVSADFLASDYCYDLEMARAMARHDEGTARVIPIILRICDWSDAPFGKLQALPKNAKPVKSWADQDEAFTDIAMGIKRAIAEIIPVGLSSTTSFRPSGQKEEISTQNFSQQASIETKSREIFRLPFPRNKFFTGREGVLNQLYKNFNRGERTQVLNGLGGIGKTQTAVEYAYRHRQDYAVVLWASANTRETLAADYAAIAALLDVPEKSAEDQSETVAAVKRWLENNSNWLLILDNADEIEIVDEFIPSCETGHLLLTTRAHAMRGGGEGNTLEKLTSKEGALFLLRRLRKLKKDEALEFAAAKIYAQAEALSILVDGLPLALDQAASFIEEKPSSLEEYQSLYHNARRELLKRRGKLAGDHLDSVAATFSLAFEKVAEGNVAAADLLKVCAFLEADSIPEEIFNEGAKELGEAISSAAKSPLGLSDAIEEAGRFSLLKRHPEGCVLSLHRLVQAVLKDEMDDDARRMWAGRAIRAVNEVFSEVAYSNWPSCERLIPHAQLLSLSVEEYGDDFFDAIVLMDRAGFYLIKRAQYAHAEQFYKRALASCEKVLGAEHPAVAVGLTKLAYLYMYQGKYGTVGTFLKGALAISEAAFGVEDPCALDRKNSFAQFYFDDGKYAEAESLYQRALAITEKAFGPEHLGVADGLDRLSYLYGHHLGKYADAESLYQRALTIREKALGPEHPDVAESLDRLGHLYGDYLGKYAEAESLYRRALAIREKALGPEHLGVVDTLNRFAGLYLEQGKYAEAESLYQRALTIREKALGPEHPDVANGLDRLGHLYGDHLGKYAMAESLYRRALAIVEKTRGLEHPDVVDSLNSLGHLYGKRLGKCAEGELLYQRALAIREKAFGLEHPIVADSLNNLALLYTDQGKYAAVEPFLKRALDIEEKALGSEHPAVVNTLNNFAYLYGDHLGKYAEAESLYRRALAIREKALGLEHPDVAESLDRLGHLYGDHLGKYAEAESLYRRALAIREKVPGPEHPAVAESLDRLGHLYGDHLGKYAEAKSFCQRALAIRENTLGPEHPAVADGLNNLASLYTEQGKYEVVEPFLERALDIKEKALGPEHPDVVNTLNRFAWLYLKQGKYAEGDPLYQRALAIREKALGWEHPAVADSLNNLASLYTEQGKYEVVEPFLKRALDIKEKALGPEHPAVVNTLNKFAWLYHEQGKYAEGEPLYQRALAIVEKAFGPEHPNVANSLDKLGHLYMEHLGKYVEAESLYQRALAIREKALGPEHPDIAESFGNLARCYYKKGNKLKAEPLYKRAIAIYEKALGWEHPLLAEPLMDYAEMLRSMRRSYDAGKLEARVKKIRGKAISKARK